MPARGLHALALALAAACALDGTIAHARGVAEELAAVQAAHATSREVQRQIDALSGALRGPSQTLEDRQLANRLRDAENAVRGQRAAIERAEAQIRTLQESEAGLMPLLQDMLDTLDRAIDVDVPFDVAARRASVAAARRSLTRHELSSADRFARVLDAYLDEVRRGYSSDVDIREISVDGEPRLVKTLRVGRLALYYVSADGEDCGLWLADRTRFVRLPAADCAAIADARPEDEHADLLTILPLPGRAP